MLEMLLKILIALTSMAIAPLLGALAFREWMKRVRKELAQWRSFLGGASFLLLFVAWISVVFVSITLAMGFSTSFYTPAWEISNLLIAVSGTGLALALKGSSRTQAMIAGSALILPWVMSLLVT